MMSSQTKCKPPFIKVHFVGSTETSYEDPKSSVTVKEAIEKANCLSDPPLVVIQSPLFWLMLIAQ